MYEIKTLDAFNRYVGYAKYLNASKGTVLYRGEDSLHDNLTPGAARGTGIPFDCVKELICKVRNDVFLQREFMLNEEDVVHNNEYCDTVIEATLQHYGAKTYCMDFVDNHWVALWFGLYRYESFSYHNRMEDKRFYKDGFVYIVLYLADTNHKSIKGLYYGKKEFTLDLRKALQSNFLRPCAQHGWIVRGRDREPLRYNENVVGIAKISVENAALWLGNGNLSSQKNFFPDFKHDVEYKNLLERQERSGYISPRMISLGDKYPFLFPKNTLTNYYYKNSIESPADSTLKMNVNIQHMGADSKLDRIANVYDLYHLLLTEGWTEETCSNKRLWNRQIVCKGQSGATALLVYEIYGGCVRSFKLPNGICHYYNIINGEIMDLTKNEILNNREYSEDDQEHELSYLYRRFKDKKEMLKQNCSLVFEKM